MFDLTQLPAHYLSVYGQEKVAEVIGVTTNVLAMWLKREKVPLAAVQKLLEFDPAPLGTIRPLYDNPQPGTKLAILVPLSGNPEPKMMDCLLKLYDRKEMAYQRLAFNCTSVVRNALAAWGLRGGFTWFFWLDGDNVVPCGDAPWFKAAADLPQMPDAFAGLHAIYRLLFHNKTIVSTCYVGRKKGAAPQFSGGDSNEMRALVKKGPQNRVIERPWSGFGGMLTHRSVFEDIIRVMGDEIRMKPDGIGAPHRFNYEYSFFDPLDRETPGDDIPFLTRAARCGHKCFVDLAVQGAHIGDRAFSYADIELKQT